MLKNFELWQMIRSRTLIHLSPKAALLDQPRHKEKQVVAKQCFMVAIKLSPNSSFYACALIHSLSCTNKFVMSN